MDREIGCSLNVHSIFKSLDGEINGFFGIGEPSTFIRLRGCNLRCVYCDTQDAQESDPPSFMSVDDIVSQVPVGSKVTITGGEPFVQEVLNLRNLLLRLVDSNKCSITVETNGSIPFPFSFWGPYIRYVVDYKLPSSGVEDRMIPEVFLSLRSCDVIKFVVKKDSFDLDRVKELLEQHKDDWEAIKAISPCWILSSSKEDPTAVFLENLKYARRLALEIVELSSRYSNVVLSFQLHKVLDLA